jgi:hypothetical protein
LAGVRPVCAQLTCAQSTTAATEAISLANIDVPSGFSRSLFNNYQRGFLSVKIGESATLISMRLPAAVVIALAFATASLPAQKQEKPLPENEVRVQIPGCAYNRTFISGTAPQGEPVGAIKEGRRFKMQAPKQVLADIKNQGRSMIEITGRIRRADLDDARGISLGGGVRVGGGRPQSPLGGSVGTNPGYSEVLIDVESFRLLPDSCPAR